MLKNLSFIKPFYFHDFKFLYLAETNVYIAIWMSSMVFGVIATHMKGNSPFHVGLIGFGFNIPMLFGPFIGVLIDRYQRSSILQVVTAVLLFAAVIMATLLLKHLLNYWLMLLLVLIYGFAGAFYYPAMVTNTHDIITDPHIIGNGISLVNSTNRIMMFIGYSLGGIFLTYFNEQFTFWFNALLFLLGFIFLTQILTRVQLPKEHKSAISELISGLHYLKTSTPTLVILVPMALMGLFIWPYIFQMPVVNRYYLHGTSGTLGLLMAIGGIGGTLGAFLISARRSTLYLNRLFIIALLVLALGMFLLAFSRSFVYTAALLFLIDFCLMIAFTISVIFIQLITPNEYLGRLMGIVTMVSFGTLPIGSIILYGGIGEPFGVMTAFVVAAVILLIGTIWYIKQIPIIRKFAAPIFVEKGLLERESELKKI